jgi:DNA-binding Xre family transcriptional regulator
METERLVADPVLIAESSEFSIRALAKKAGVSENTIKGLRRGERLRRKTVERLCAAVRVLKSAR